LLAQTAFSIRFLPHTLRQVRHTNCGISAVFRLQGTTFEFTPFGDRDNAKKKQMFTFRLKRKHPVWQFDGGTSAS
jgi:hypothetical protein